MLFHLNTTKFIKVFTDVVLSKGTGWLGAALLALTLTPSYGQQSPALSKHAENIKKQVDSYSPGAFLAVKCARRPELSGVLLSEDDTSFELEDGDTHQNVRLLYEDVKKVKTPIRKYGKPPNNKGRTLGRVGGGVVILGLIIYLIVALHSGS